MESEYVGMGAGPTKCSGSVYTSQSRQVRPKVGARMHLHVMVRQDHV